MPFVAMSDMSPVQNVSHPPGLYPQWHPHPTPYVDTLFFRF